MLFQKYFRSRFGGISFVVLKVLCYNGGITCFVLDVLLVLSWKSFQYSCGVITWAVLEVLPVFMCRYHLCFWCYYQNCWGGITKPLWMYCLCCLGEMTFVVLGVLSVLFRRYYLCCFGGISWSLLHWLCRGMTQNFPCLPARLSKCWDGPSGFDQHRPLRQLPEPEMIIVVCDQT